MCRDGKKTICQSKNVVYRHVCRLCKDQGRICVYTGMTSRKLWERAIEHDEDMKNRLPSSHAWLHVMEEHGDVIDGMEKADLPNLFTWEIQKSCRTAFERTVSEAVLIQLSVEGNETSLNSGDEWGAYEAPELTIKERRRRYWQW